MIPLSLSLSGFLSYQEPAEVDFTAFDLACISGANGAGKSSLLDAITWVLFGPARKRDDSLINTRCDRAEVSLVFAYEGNIYRIQRTKPREKVTVLEFQILQTPGSGDQAASVANLDDLQCGSAAWKPLTERALRETETKIQETLRMDYETFVNASFFLQGKADQFAQQTPGKRKQILGSILGLEIWEQYRERAAERRKSVEAEIENLDGRLQEINAELAEEEARWAQLKQLEKELKRQSEQRAAQEKIVSSARQIAATLAEQARLVEALARQMLAAAQRADELESRYASRRTECEATAQILARAEEIEANYAAWQALRLDMERWEEVAERFRQHEKRREAPRLEIQAEGARLEQELRMLQNQQVQIVATSAEITQLESQITALQQALAQLEAHLAQRSEVESVLQAARERQAQARTENPRLKQEMEELKVRLDQLGMVEGALCPLCGQPLNPGDRKNLIERLNAEGKELGDRYRANQGFLREAEFQVLDGEAKLSAFTPLEAERRRQEQALAQLSNRLEMLQAGQAAWQSDGASRLQQVTLVLASENYAHQARADLSAIDEELKAIGYDAATHDSLRKTELEARPVEAELRSLERARAALQPLERELAELEIERNKQAAEVARQQAEHDNAAAALAAAQAQAPDLFAAEQVLLSLQEQENRLRSDVGAARQKVDILDNLKKRRKQYEAQREETAGQVKQYKLLERAFGKDGVPALLIEQALPQIESKANEILDRLSAGSMSVSFATQAAFKDTRREDLKETLDIRISDGAGTRDYEMFSGGEAFRVDFAIRLALSEVLAQRAGARLQTLVVDEGFGSQDAEGRQRLIEAINLVRPDFAKILVITHIDELKDAFPTRIEVEKTNRGSVIQVV